MSEGDAKVTVGTNVPRLTEVGRAIARGVKTTADAANGLSFADSLASASQSFEGETARTDDSAGDGGAAQGDRRSSDSSQTASSATNARPPAFTAIRPEGRSFSATQPTIAASQPAPVFAPTSSAPSQPTAMSAAEAAAAAALQTATSQASAQAAAPTTIVTASQAANAAAASAPPAGQSAQVGQAQVPPTQTPPPAQAVQAAQSSPYGYPAAYPQTGAAALPPGTVVYTDVQSGVPMTPASAASAYADGRARTQSSGAYVAPAAAGAPPIGNNVQPGAGTATTNAPASTSASDGGSTGKVLALKEYPKPDRADRSGVLNWISDVPPTGKDLDQFIAEARHRKVGWVTFTANPDRLDEYGDLTGRLTKAGIQPIARIEDPYGDLPVGDVTALVKELRANGVTYFQLFDGGNVAQEMPDDTVDVQDYANRWLAAAKAVVAEGGLPGFGALAPKGDYDELAFMRQVLRSVKDQRGGTEVLGQSWVALRNDTAGPRADMDDVADRATWFDRVSRQAIGRSMPILATQDPNSEVERLSTDPISGTPTSQSEDSERSLRQHQRKLPALFAVSRGTLGAPRG